MLKTLIIIPTYNEKQNIEKLVAKVFEVCPQTHILIVDDNSPDGTGILIDQLIADNIYNTQLHVMHRAGKLGLGTAYIEGFKWGLAQGFEAFVSMDADFSHNPDYLPEMVKQLQSADLVIGSRYVKGGGVEDWSWLRRFISRGGNIYAQCVLLSNVHDLTGGFNGYHAAWLKKINLDKVMSKGYCFQIEMKFRHILGGAKVKEFPIVFTDRILGKSKMNSHIFKEAVLKVLQLSLRRFKIKRELNI